jgi:hypothetical protein
MGYTRNQGATGPFSDFTFRSATFAAH